jgi:hypothetical protein
MRSARRIRGREPHKKRLGRRISTRRRTGSLYVIKTLPKMGHYQRGCDTYIELSGALFLNLEAPVESRSLLRRFFTQGWGAVPGIVDEAGAVHLANEAGNALAVAGELQEASAAYGAALAVDLRCRNWHEVRDDLSRVSAILRSQNRLAQEDRCLLLSLGLATLMGVKEGRCFREPTPAFCAACDHWPLGGGRGHLGTARSHEPRLAA